MNKERPLTYVNIDKSTTVAAGNMFSNNAFLGLGDLAAATDATAPGPATVPPLFTDYSAPTNSFDSLLAASVSML